MDHKIIRKPEHRPEYVGEVRRCGRWPISSGARPTACAPGRVRRNVMSARGRGRPAQRRRGSGTSSVIGLFKTEVINVLGPWRTMRDVEWQTLRWIDWYNNRRLLAPIGYIPPAQAEKAYFANIKALDQAAWPLKQSSSGKARAVKTEQRLRVGSFEIAVPDNVHRCHHGVLVGPPLGLAEAQEPVAGGYSPQRSGPGGSGSAASSSPGTWWPHPCRQHTQRPSILNAKVRRLDRDSVCPKPLSTGSLAVFRRTH